MKINRVLFLFFGLCIFLAGCNRISENTVNEILEKDPAFGRLLEEKRSIKAKIYALDDKFSKERDETLGKIELLKKGLNDKNKKLNEEVLSLKQSFNPTIDVLEADLLKRYAKRTEKAKALKDASGKLQNITKLLEKKGELSLSGDEIAIWNTRIKSLEEKITAIQRGLDELDAGTRILKTEIAILKE